MSTTRSATLKVFASLIAMTVCTVPLFLHIYIWLVARELFGASNMIFCTLTAGYAIIFLTLAIRSAMRLALEMRKEYCFDCNCSCKQKSVADQPGDSAGEFQKDPSSPDVLMYPAVP